MFEEQVGWAADAGVDYVIAETFFWAEEALIALDVVKQAGLPAVVTLAIHSDGTCFEGWSPGEACRRLEAAGADVVGLNCLRGPSTMLPLLGRCETPSPCPSAGSRSRTGRPRRGPRSSRSPIRARRGLPITGPSRTLSTASPALASRSPISRARRAAGISYLGVCCGGGPHHVREPGRGPGPNSAREPLLARHVEARVPRDRSAGAARVPGVRREALGAAPGRQRALRRPPRRSRGCTRSPRRACGRRPSSGRGLRADGSGRRGRCPRRACRAPAASARRARRR